jgi:hypothetical protein
MTDVYQRQRGALGCLLLVIFIPLAWLGLVVLLLLFRIYTEGGCL